jgi:hypothetical protein
MAECSNAASQQMAEVNMLNAKLGYDSAAQLQHQSMVDNQVNARAWNSLNLSVATDLHSVRLATLIAGALAGQVGVTEGQQTTSPVRTGTGDAIVGTEGVAAAGEAVAAQAVATSLGNLATAMVPIITAAGGVVTAQTLAALLPIVVNAVGGASTPSQTQPKSAGA